MESTLNLDVLSLSFSFFSDADSIFLINISKKKSFNASFLFAFAQNESSAVNLC